MQVLHPMCVFFLRVCKALRFAYSHSSVFEPCSLESWKMSLLICLGKSEEKMLDKRMNEKNFSAQHR
jgi:hypothetical protein